MSQDTKSTRASPLGRRGGMAAITVMVLLTSPFWRGAEAADKDAKSTPSMDMNNSKMEDMKDMPMTGNTDYDFATLMKKHHQMALDMAQAELQNGKDPTLRSMAKKIIASQKNEIKQFDQWLAKHKQ